MGNQWVSTTTKLLPLTPALYSPTTTHKLPFLIPITPPLINKYLTTTPTIISIN